MLKFVSPELRKAANEAGFYGLSDAQLLAVEIWVKAEHGKDAEIDPLDFEEFVEAYDLDDGV